MMGTSAELSLTQISPKKVIVSDWGRGSFLVAQFNREEKSLRHVAMVAKFLDDNKPKTSLKKWIRIINVIDFIQFHLICQILAKFLGLNPKGRYLSSPKGRENSYVVLTCSLKRAREIRKFHVAVVQRRLRSVQKSVMHVQSCCFANINQLLFCHSRCRRHRRCSSSPMLSSKNFATMVTWRHTSPLYRWMTPSTG